MAEKLQELQRMMADEGMMESLAMLQKCTDTIGKHKQSVNSNIGHEKQVNFESSNKDTNASRVKDFLLEDGKSIETIYKMAVPK